MKFNWIHLWSSFLLIFFFSLDVTTGVPIHTENSQNLFVEGGSEVEPHEFPWQVSLRSSLHNLHFCGGVIIDEKTILTTATCAENANPYLTTVFAGSLNLTLNTSESQQIVQVTSVHIHPNYAENTDYSNDIAILKVNPAFLSTEDVSPIPTLHNEYQISEDYGVICGWGTNREEEISLQEKLQKATVGLLSSNQDCQHRIDDESLELEVTIEDSMICITNPSSNESLADSCTADQGGPLIAFEDGNPVLVGLISFGIGCGRPNMPSFCTRVSPYITFIRQYQESTL